MISACSCCRDLKQSHSMRKQETVAGAAEAEARMQKLKQAGSESWSALSAALAESRKAFDRANQEAWDALKRAAPPKT